MSGGCDWLTTLPSSGRDSAIGSHGLSPPAGEGESLLRSPCCLAHRAALGSRSRSRQIPLRWHLHQSLPRFHRPLQFWSLSSLRTSGRIQIPARLTSVWEVRMQCPGMREAWGDRGRSRGLVWCLPERGPGREGWGHEAVHQPTHFADRDSESLEKGSVFKVTQNRCSIWDTNVVFCSSILCS